MNEDVTIGGRDARHAAAADAGHAPPLVTPVHADEASTVAALFAGPGQMRALARAFDWSSTPLGPVGSWPIPLRTGVRLMLAAPVATCLWVGASYTLIYNESYARILGAKHPGALGRSGDAVWDELWPALRAQFEQVRSGGAPIFEDEAVLRMERLADGKAEDAWFIYGLSALTDEPRDGLPGACLAVYNIGVEITDRARAQAQRDAEQARLALVFEKSPSFLAVMRGDDNVLDLVNEAYYRLVGHRDVLGKPLFEALPETRGQGFDTILAQVRATGEPMVFHELPAMLQVTPDKPPVQRFVEITFLPLPEPDGRIEAVIAHGSDVTNQVMARREVERLLEASEVARAGAEAAAAELRAQALELASANERLQENAAQLESANEELQAVAVALEERSEEAEQARGAADVATRRLKFLADASEQFASSLDFEVTLREVVALAVPSVADWSAYTVDAGDGTLRILAMHHQDAARERFAREVAARFPVRADEPAGAARVLRTGEPELISDLPDDLLQAVAQDAEHLRMLRAIGFRSLMTVPVVTQGRVIGVLSFGTGDSERRFTSDDLAFALELARRAAAAVDNAILYREAQRARVEAEAANHAKNQFLSTMSHELRTPLNAIGGYADLLSLGIRGPVNTEQQQDLARLSRANQHLIGLIGDVLNFARIEEGQVEYQITSFGLGPILTDLEALMGPQLIARGISFDHDGCISASPDAPHTVHADAEKVRQIMLNLLTNAVKFTAPGGRITLHCETDSAAREVRLGVTDTGRGIPAAQLERIFEPFVQVDRHLTHESQQGVGLGLAISRDLARGMGGNLTVESVEGEGSTFTLTLPCV